MEDLVNKYYEPDELSVDLFFGTFRAVQACLELPRNRRFVVCQVNAEFYAASAEALVATYGRQVLNMRLVISGSDDVVAARKILIPSMRAL